MKKLNIFFWVILLSFSFSALNIIAQEGPADERMWSRIDINPTPYVSGDPNYKWDPVPYRQKFYNFGGGITVDPNFRPLGASNTTQSEMSVDVNPSDENIVFCSANATNWPFTTIYGTGMYWSLDGAQTTPFMGSNDPLTLGVPRNSGDPASVIGNNGNFYEAFISGSGGMGMFRSTNNGTTWTNHNVNSGSDDKEHMMADQDGSSPFVDRLYYVWTAFSGAAANNIAYKRSTDFGTSWSSLLNLSGSLNAGSHDQGCNVQTGPNGEVYVTWAIYDAWPGGEDAIGFAKSTDGGVTFTASRIYGALTPNGNFNFGIRGTLGNKSGIRVASFPAMGVDRSGGPNDGKIYIIWPQRNVAPAGSDPDIVLITSSDGGTTWTSPILVNDDQTNDQYYPWIHVDQSNGNVVAIWYDSRETTNDSAGVFMGLSQDGGVTWQNFKVSDENFKPKPIPGLAGGYQGDYIGVASLNNVAYPYWADDRTGNYQGWMSVVSFGPPCPVDAASNPTPANGSVDVPIGLTEITWNNGAGANNIEVFFGEAGNMGSVYTGTPISTWPVSGLSYGTTYQWRVNSANDTCGVNGPVWSFTIEDDPNIIIDELYCDDFESGIGDWTITNQGGTCVWEIFTPPYPNTYTLPGTSSGGVLAADSDECGSGTTMLTTATLTQSIDFSIYNVAAWIEFDNDWRIISSSDEAHVEVSTDGGSSWQTAISWVGVDQRNTHEVVDITGIAAGQSDVRFRLRTIQPGWDWWWVVDNFCIYGETIVPVELTSFTASAISGTVQLNWATATETNNQGFDIERKSNGSQFEKIGYLAGFGTTTETKAYTFTDSKVSTGAYTYRLKQIDFDGSFEYSPEVEVDVASPIEYALEQNFPNPFNPSTMIKYSIPQDGFVKLAIYNMLGEEVALLVNTQQKAGRYEVDFNAAGLASGVYVYRLETSNFVTAKKLMLMK